MPGYLQGTSKRATSAVCLERYGQVLCAGGYLRRGRQQHTLEQSQTGSGSQVVQVALLQLWCVCEGQLMQCPPCTSSRPSKSKMHLGLGSGKSRMPKRGVGGGGRERVWGGEAEGLGRQSELQCQRVAMVKARDNQFV